MADAKEKFWNEWGIAGMPGDKQRLAEAAWQAALAEQPAQGEAVAWTDGVSLQWMPGYPRVTYGQTVPLYTAPPAPCVPDAMEDDDPIMSGYAEGWNACRDAMLASGGKANVPDAVSKDAARYRYLRTVLRPNQFVFMPTHKSDEIALKNDAAVDGTMARLAAPEPSNI